MRAVVTRVCSASVCIGGEEFAAIGRGLLVLLACKEGDESADVRYIADKCVHLRIFEDGQGKMNRSLLEEGGQILLVSQFTLMGDARKGRRPSFSRSGDPLRARVLFDETADALRRAGVTVQTGRFGADMQVASVNDGPVTILLDSERTF